MPRQNPSSKKRKRGPSDGIKTPTGGIKAESDPFAKTPKKTTTRFVWPQPKPTPTPPPMPRRNQRSRSSNPIERYKAHYEKKRHRLAFQAAFASPTRAMWHTLRPRSAHAYCMLIVGCLVLAI